MNTDHAYIHTYIQNIHHSYRSCIQITQTSIHTYIQIHIHTRNHTFADRAEGTENGPKLFGTSITCLDIKSVPVSCEMVLLECAGARVKVSAAARCLAGAGGGALFAGSAEGSRCDAVLPPEACAFPCMYVCVCV